MRKADRIIRNRHSRIPDKYKKIDTTVNGNAEILAEQHKEVERQLFPLRLNKTTIIYVTKRQAKRNICCKST